MKRNRVLVSLALAGLLAAGSGAALAFGGGCDGGNRGHRGFGSVGAAYHVDNLTAEQRQQLDTLRDQQRKQMDQMRDDRIAVREAMNKGADAKTLRPLAEKQGKDVTEMIMRQAELRAGIDKILTPAQRTQLQQMQNDRAPGKGRDFGPRW
jgi:Spy/CpxP family protein refolding chaperone